MRVWQCRYSPGKVACKSVAPYTLRSPRFRAMVSRVRRHKATHSQSVCALFCTKLRSSSSSSTSPFLPGNSVSLKAGRFPIFSQPSHDGLIANSEGALDNPAGSCGPGRRQHLIFELLGVARPVGSKRKGVPARTQSARCSAIARYRSVDRHAPAS